MEFDTEAPKEQIDAARREKREKKGKKAKKKEEGDSESESESEGMSTKTCYNIIMRTPLKLGHHSRSQLRII